MNSFGLGLVLNFTDNASAGMRRASQSFQDMNGIINQLGDTADSTMFAVQALSSTGLVLNIIGDQVTQLGRSITDVFAGLTQSVISTGTAMQGQKLTLNTLFKSVEEGEKAFQWAKDFAKTSVFNFQDLLPAMTTMKSVGIDVRDEVTATSGATQNLLEYASDLAAVFPNMRNSYGTGVQASMGALKEYIAEGNAISLKRGAGLDIEQILGEDKADTIEERTRQVADLIDKLGILGMTANLAGTPMQRLSNAQDLWFNTLTEISDSGVFEKYSSLVAKFTDYLFAIPEEEMTNIAQVIGSAIMSLMSPLEKLLDAGIMLADWIRGLVKEHPNIAKLVITLTAFTGVALVGAGMFMKFAGGILMFLASITMLGISATQGITILGLFKNTLSFLIPKLLTFSTIAGLIYIAWSQNLLGLRDLFTEVFSDLWNVLALTFDAFNDNSLTEDAWVKARELGILPFIESVLILKYYTEIFIDSFKRGFQSVFDTIDQWFSKFEPIKISVLDLANTVGEFFSSITGIEDMSTWEQVGDIVGKIVGVLTIALPLIKIVSVLIGALATPIGLIVTALTLLYIAWDNNFLGMKDKVQVFFDWLGSIDFGSLFETLLSPISGIVEKVFKAFEDVGFLETLAFVGAFLLPLFNNLWDIGVSLLPLINIIFEYFVTVGGAILDVVINNIMPVLVMIIDRVVEFVGIVIIWFSILVSAIKPLIQKIVDWVVIIWDSWLKDLITNIIQFVGNIVEIIGRVAVVIYDYFIKPIGELIGILLTVLLPVISVVVGTAIDLFMSLLNAVGGIITGLMEVLNGIIDFIVGVFTGDWDRAWNGVVSVFTGIFNTIESIAKGVINGVISIINGFISGFNTFKVPDWVPEIGGKGVNMPNIPYLSTGGEIKSEGISYLHPNEVVVNSDLTRTLGMFLGDYKNSKKDSNGQTATQPETQASNFSKNTINVNPMLGNTPTSRGSETNNSQPIQEQNDYSVTFAPGSIVFNVKETTKAELEKMANELISIIERKQELKKMSKRQKARA